MNEKKQTTFSAATSFFLQTYGKTSHSEFSEPMFESCRGRGLLKKYREHEEPKRSIMFSVKLGVNEDVMTVVYNKALAHYGLCNQHG